MNREEKSEHPNAEMQTNKTESLMRLNVQRLVKNNFCILISEAAFVTNLKEEILEFLQQEEPETESPGLSVGHLRLIYKGKVLLNAKSLSFYKIQNNDTVQLCPIRRKYADQPLSNPAGGAMENEDDRNEERKQQFVIEPIDVTIISFTTLGQPHFERARNLLFQNFRTSNLGPQNSVSSNHASTRSRPQRRSQVTTTANTSNLRDFTLALQGTLRRL